MHHSYKEAYFHLIYDENNIVLLKVIKKCIFLSHTAQFSDNVHGDPVNAVFVPCKLLLVRCYSVCTSLI